MTRFLSVLVGVGVLGGIAASGGSDSTLAVAGDAPIRMPVLAPFSQPQRTNVSTKIESGRPKVQPNWQSEVDATHVASAAALLARP